MADARGCLLLCALGGVLFVDAIANTSAKARISCMSRSPSVGSGWWRKQHSVPWTTPVLSTMGTLRCAPMGMAAVAGMAWAAGRVEVSGMHWGSSPRTTFRQ